MFTKPAAYSFILLALIASCSDVEEATLISPTSLSARLSICYDSLGSPYFGAISDTDFLSNGCIAVSDRVLSSVLVFSSNGDYLYSVGGDGEGPGEFRSPDCVVPTAEGTFFVYDSDLARVTEFTNLGELLQCFESNSHSIPVWVKPRGNNRFIGGFASTSYRDDNWYIEYRVCSYTDSISTVDTLFTNSAILPADDNISFLLRNTLYSCSFTADEYGNAFISPVSSDTYLVNGFTHDNSDFVTISQSVSIVRKSSDEIAEEQERFTSILRHRNTGFTGSFEPLEYRNQIPPQGLHCADSCIWVLRGTELSPVFDVYDYSGVHGASYALTGFDAWDNSEVLWWSMSASGILAFSVDPYVDPAVYVFDLPN